VSDAVATNEKRRTKSQAQHRRNVPRWYKIELMAVKKKSETIATLPFSVISVLFEVSFSFVMVAALSSCLLVVLLSNLSLSDFCIVCADDDHHHHREHFMIARQR
jgi:hypothetical protein